MTPNDPIDPLEKELGALFDATAEELDGPGRTRLAARAVEIPDEVRGRRWNFLWWLSPALAGAGALAAVVAFNLPALPTDVGGPTGGGGPVAALTATTAAPVATPREAPTAVAEADAEVGDLDDLDLFLVGDELPGDALPVSGGGVAGDGGKLVASAEADRDELAAFLAAADDLYDVDDWFDDVDVFDDDEG